MINENIWSDFNNSVSVHSALPLPGDARPTEYSLESLSGKVRLEARDAMPMAIAVLKDAHQRKLFAEAYYRELKKIVEEWEGDRP